MTDVPHLFVHVRLMVDGKEQDGIAAETLPPKWFTKDPERSFEQDLKDMLRVIRHAGTIAESVGKTPTIFDLWHAVYQAQNRWATEQGYPPLLWNLGVSLIERAAIDAYCRGKEMTFFQAIQTNALGIRLGELRPELVNQAPAHLLPSRPLEQIIVRHTVGLGDPIDETDIDDANRVDDGLPQSLEANIRAYGLTHFKLKIGGDPPQDKERLRRIATAIEANCPGAYAFTLDGNETYTELASFQNLWEELHRDRDLKRFLNHLSFVEQPLQRHVALDDETGRALRRWADRPPIIIDESDGALESLPRALDCGYVGTSHKNCKGVIKGITNACQIYHRRRINPTAPYLISAEDLANIGPVALLQDLTVIATLGIEQAERNGHHYFTGLRMFPHEMQAQVLTDHSDLYARHAADFPHLAIADGKIEIGSLLQAPFGVRSLPNLSAL